MEKAKIENKIKQTKEFPILIDMENDVNELEVFAYDKFDIMPFDFFGVKGYKIRKKEK